MTEKAKTIGACVKSDKGELLPYTTRATIENCEEEMGLTYSKWNNMKAIGFKVVQVEITEK